MVGEGAWGEIVSRIVSFVGGAYLRRFILFLAKAMNLKRVESATVLFINKRYRTEGVATLIYINTLH